FIFAFKLLLSFDIDDISKMFGQAGGPAGSLDDLLGGLLGGGATATTGAAGGTGGLLGGLSKMLGGLLGGGNRRATPNVQTGGDVGSMLGGLLGSSAGKVLVSGMAAYLMKELMDGKG
ncbi:MAG TPA: hypothetical protein PK691_10260, partial [Thermomicrobiales bacterium]|nr:hypothetical protein [Thermomicrobiales bacterium]